MNVSTLAKSMNVTESDVNSLLRMVADSIAKDGMTTHVVGMNKEDMVNTVQAYIAAEVKKFSEFCMSLLTNQEKKSAFDQYMFSQIKG